MDRSRRVDPRWINSLINDITHVLDARRQPVQTMIDLIEVVFVVILVMVILVFMVILVAMIFNTAPHAIVTVVVVVVMIMVVVMVMVVMVMEMASNSNADEQQQQQQQRSLGVHLGRTLQLPTGVTRSLAVHGLYIH